MACISARSISAFSTEGGCHLCIAPLRRGRLKARPSQAARVLWLRGRVDSGAAQPNARAIHRDRGSMPSQGKNLLHAAAHQTDSQTPVAQSELTVLHLRYIHTPVAHQSHTQADVGHLEVR